MNFWSRVQDILDSEGISRKELAAVIGYDQSNIGKGIRAGSCPVADVALKVAQYLNVPLESLIFDPETGTPAIHRTNSHHNQPVYEIHKNTQSLAILNELNTLPEDQRNHLANLIHSLSESYSAEKNKNEDKK